MLRPESGGALLENASAPTPLGTAVPSPKSAPSHRIMRPVVHDAPHDAKHALVDKLPLRLEHLGLVEQLLQRVR
eukprot:9186-Prymnesium_polylepis.1